MTTFPSKYQGQPLSLQNLNDTNINNIPDQKYRFNFYPEINFMYFINSFK